MAIQPNEIQYRLSGGAANSAPAASLGGAKSATAVAGGAFFDAITGAESSAGRVKYRGFYVHNANQTLTLVGAVLWITSNTPLNTTTVDVGLGVSAVNAVEPAIANETTAPANVTFSAAASQGAGLALGDIPPGQGRYVWVRLTIDAGTQPTPVNAPDAFNIRTTGDTAA